MRLQALLLLVSLIALHTSPSLFCIAAEKTSVALTTTVSADADESLRRSASNLMSLIELGLLADESLAVVERQQLNLAIQELALNRSRSADESLQLGKLATADLLVMMELRKTNESTKPAAILRIVESKTAAIRGVTAASELEESNFEETAEQFSRYIMGMIRGPQLPVATVAVAPFECVGRFDRLRPLELGIRDLVTWRLLWRAGANVSEKPATGKLETIDAPRFQVLQRNNLEQLLREIDLIQSGFVDKDQLPKSLPARQAALLVKGEIDERQTDGQFRIIVRGKLIDAATTNVRYEFEFDCIPAEVESQLAGHVDRLSTRLGVLDTETASEKNRVGNEALSLKSLALRDLHRFHRLNPIDFSHREFRLSRDHRYQGVLRFAKPDTPLGRALLRKSIDRLESALYINPDDIEAAYGLGFCFSLQEPDIYQPMRSDELLRKVYWAQPQSELGAMALEFLGDIGFHHITGQLNPEQRNATVERIWFSFEKLPEKYRDHLWPRRLGLFEATERTIDQSLAIMTKAAAYAEQADAKYQDSMAGQVQAMAVGLAWRAKNDPATTDKALELLRRWAEGSNMQLADYGRQGLAKIAANSNDFLAAAIQFEESAKLMEGLKTPADRHKHDVQLIHAAKHYRLAKQPERGLRLLRSFIPSTPIMSSIMVGMHGFECGMCLEALGEKQQALDVYLKAAEECPGIVDNSEIFNRIRDLGGVPLNEDREIDVRYPAFRGNKLRAAPLATDGSRLFVGGQFVSVFDLDTESETEFRKDLGNVTKLQYRPQELWAGTNGNGIWRCALGTNQWTQFGTAQGLPDLRVASLALDKRHAYAGIGTFSSGGLVRIDENGLIHAFTDPEAPQVAPNHIIVDEKQLLAVTATGIHIQNVETGKWHIEKPKPGEFGTQHLFVGQKNIWASGYGRELSIWGADDAVNQSFKPAWYFVPGTKAGVVMNFVAERGDDVWFGGDQWFRLTSSGLYRFNRKTHVFTKFSSRDGFKTASIQSISDGLWLRDKLWLTTSSGLCVVTPRNGTSFQPEERALLPVQVR